MDDKFQEFMPRCAHDGVETGISVKGGVSIGCGDCDESRTHGLDELPVEFLAELVLEAAHREEQVVVALASKVRAA